ncbi:hypothetical protein Mtai_v1c18220 [Meiothermus taiwanensis WR-220]|jgi:antitoxin (DNA-binding transcriptional repressor) of toxin-antitoxin stability system|uniref:Antitoxin n=1 Tax=Meiothermus taiwanensis WR-220 TaxID=1339250 RepID=A0ABM6WIT7_9DEIN|nr:hypothetical protein Mtai_v1c18220 [Meiothermus taiwanensis WR-220]
MLKVAIGKTLAFVRGVDVLQAQLHLEELVEEAERGEAVAIERDGEPVAMLVRYRGGVAPRRLGGWEGKVRMAPTSTRESVASSRRARSSRPSEAAVGARPPGLTR